VSHQILKEGLFQVERASSRNQNKDTFHTNGEYWTKSDCYAHVLSLDENIIW